MEHEYGTKVRLLRVMQAIMEQPYRYTKKGLAELYGVHEDTIKQDFDAFRTAGFELDYDTRYRYGFKVDKPYEELKSLFQLSETNQLGLLKAVSELAAGHPEFETLRDRLASLLEYTQREHAYMRRPYLTKVKLLEQAKAEKRQVLLLDYHSSNSNMVADRRVEPFFFKAEEDILQAFDVDKEKLRHFRLSRIKRIRLLDTPWSYEGQHQVLATDPFRIVDNRQVMVHLRMRVGAYNELVERFPASKAYIQEDAEDEGVYDFQCQVNHRFFGLTNFILGFYHQIVEILEPEELKAHLQAEIRKMTF
jgi:predicted DNA-binding transcriptional regulator YafY